MAFVMATHRMSWDTQPRFSCKVLLLPPTGIWCFSPVNCYASILCPSFESILLLFVSEIILQLCTSFYEVTDDLLPHITMSQLLAYSSPPSKLSSQPRGYTSQEWEAQRSEISRLYDVEDIALKDVVQIMKSNRSFFATYVSSLNA